MVALCRFTNNGSYHKELEKALAEYLKVPYVSLFTNGTLPLMTALQALRITGEVITTPYSFVATTHSIWWNGCKSVFVDIAPATGDMDPNKIEARHQVAIKYREALRPVEGITFFDDMPGVKHNYSYFRIFIDAEKYGMSRDELYFKMKAANVLDRRFIAEDKELDEYYIALINQKLAGIKVANHLFGWIAYFQAMTDILLS